MKRSAIALLAIACVVSCTSSPSPAVKGIDVTKDGTHETDGWKYVFDVKETEEKVDGWWGYLYRNGSHLGDLPNLPVGRKMQTPWGPMYWVGVPQMVTGYHGWLPFDLARDAWISRQKPENWKNIGDFQQIAPPLPSEGAPSDGR